jgi:CHAP domain
MGLELFVHATHGGGWSSHLIEGAPAGVGAISIAAAKGGLMYLAQRTVTGDVTVSEGSVRGAYTTMDVSATVGAPAALGRPDVLVDATGVTSVWYRTSLGDLEVLTQPRRDAPWTATDVTTSIGGTPLEGDPTVMADAGSAVGYAVTQDGAIAMFSPPANGSPVWTESDPTGGLAYAPLIGGVAVLQSPDPSAATILLARSPSGDVVELSDELPGPPATLGIWHAWDLTGLGAPAAAGPISAIEGSAPAATYTTELGDVEALTFTSGLLGAFTSADLTRASDLAGAAGAEPIAVAGPAGPSVALRTMTGDLLVASIATATSVADLSFDPHTAELIAADPAAASIAGEEVLVAADGGPIAPTPLLRRIVLRASSFDQQHRGFQTTPYDSNCNPFTAAFGRGSTSGCAPGNSAEEWCSDFAEFVWQTSGIPTAGITGWAATFITWGVKHHRVQLGTRFHAQPGDAIVWGQRTPLYGQHVGIIVSVLGKYLEIVSGNSDGDFPGFGSGVWRWGPFIGSTSTVFGYKVLGVVSP